MPPPNAAEIGRKWIELYNDGTPDFYGSDRIWELYDEAVDWHEMPTRWFPEGRSGDLATLRGALPAAQAAMRNRHAILHQLVSDGDEVAMRYSWEAEVVADSLPVPRGTSRLEIAAFFTVRDGKIVRAVEYLSPVPMG